MYVSVAGLPITQLPAAGKAFVAAFQKTIGGATLAPYSVYAAQAADVILQAIAKSDGTRAGVASELFKVNIPNGILGPIAFNKNGDVVGGPGHDLQGREGAADDRQGHRPARTRSSRRPSRSASAGEGVRALPRSPARALGSPGLAPPRLPRRAPPPLRGGLPASLPTAGRRARQRAGSVSSTLISADADLQRDLLADQHTARRRATAFQVTPKSLRSIVADPSNPTRVFPNGSPAEPVDSRLDRDRAS